MSILVFANLVRRHLIFCRVLPYMASIDDPAANSPRVWNRRSFTTNYTSGLHSQSVQSSIGIARIGTFVAVVIETLEHKAVSESSEVMTKLTANSCIALCSSKNAVSNSSALQSNPSRRRDARQQSRSFAPGNQWLKSSLNSNSFAETVSDDFPVLHTQ